MGDSRQEKDVHSSGRRAGESRVGWTRAVKIAVDVAMSAVLVATMATALVQEVPHEWLGAALFVLMAAHIFMNRRWIAAIPCMRRTPLRVAQVLTMAGLVACLVGQIASSLVLSRHVFGFLPALPGAGWARRAHMLCSYWMFVLAFAHAGLHIRAKGMLAKMSGRGSRGVAVALVVVALACYGAYSFVRLGLGAYLLGQVQFAAADFDAPLALSFARYASVAVLMTLLAALVRAALDAAVYDKGDSPLCHDRGDRFPVIRGAGGRG